MWETFKLYISCESIEMIMKPKTAPIVRSTIQYSSVATFLAFIAAAEGTKIGNPTFFPGFYFY